MNNDMIQSVFARVAHPIPEDEDRVPAFLDQISELIFQNFILHIGYETYRFSEIEYYINSYFHEDPFTHQDPRQTDPGKWYVHESGMDITFGVGNIYASILIRGIMEESTNGFISGPLKVMKKVFTALNSIDNKNHEFFIEYKENIEETSWIKHKRIGLNKETEYKYCHEKNLDVDENDLFIDKQYRHISWLMPYHSFRNKLRILEDELISEADPDVIQKAFSYTPKFLKEFLEKQKKHEQSD
ncbi:hypothetical protein ACFLR8_01530 [Bacteroidota bacterium]